MLKISFDYALDVTPELLIKKYQKKVKKIHETFLQKVKSNKPQEMVGWYNFPRKFKDFETIKQKVIEWQELKITDVVVVGLGGSYTGIKALLSMVLPNPDEWAVRIHFVHSLSTNSLHTIIENTKKTNFALVCISKSGRTIETAIGFRIFRELLFKKYGVESRNRIVVITDKSIGTLREIAQANDYTAFTIPSDIGGRFSSITPVSLFIAALVGIDIEAVIEGAKKAQKKMLTDDMSKNQAYLYAAFRHYMYTCEQKDLEFFIVYEENLFNMGVQHQQLFAESEGKKNGGIFPVFSIFTSDLHSIGQYLQEGKKIFFETTLLIKNNNHEVLVPTSSFNDDDELGYLAEHTVDSINNVAAYATLTAHSVKGGTPNLLLILDSFSAESFGYLYFFLSVATMMSCYLLGVNPFNQPGVETYKKIMHNELKNNG